MGEEFFHTVFFLRGDVNQIVSNDVYMGFGQVRSHGRRQFLLGLSSRGQPLRVGVISLECCTFPWTSLSESFHLAVLPVPTPVCEFVPILRNSFHYHYLILARLDNTLMWLGFRFWCLSGKRGKDEELRKKQELKEICNLKLKTLLLQKTRCPANKKSSM